MPAPYCGDKSVDTGFGEGCDDGVNSGMPGSCTTDCKSYVPLPSCGNSIKDPNEQCDDGPQNGLPGSTCDVHCKFKCGDGVKDTGMKAFASRMTTHQIWDVVNYLRSIGPDTPSTPR